MELVRTVDAVDYAVSGEADVAFRPAAGRAERGPRPGVGARRARAPGRRGRRAGPEAAPFDRLDELPVPDYHEFFDGRRRSGLARRLGATPVTLPFESARGCWWGAKRHCTFCGLNGSTMAFRAKSPDRVRAELAELAAPAHAASLRGRRQHPRHAYIDDAVPGARRRRRRLPALLRGQGEPDPRDRSGRCAAAGCSASSPASSRSARGCSA